MIKSNENLSNLIIKHREKQTNNEEINKKIKQNHFYCQKGKKLVKQPVLTR